MPIVDVQFVLPHGATLPEGAAKRLANAIGAALAVPDGGLWLRLQVVPANQFAENGDEVRSDELPVFLTVLHANPKEGAELQAEATALAKAVAETLAMPRTRVHIEYAPPGAGRVAFGGNLIH
jgi:hypothetical protein